MVVILEPILLGSLAQVTDGDNPNVELNSTVEPTASSLDNSTTDTGHVNLTYPGGKKTTPEGYLHAEQRLRNITDDKFMRSIRPNIYGEPVRVFVDFFIVSFGPVDERDMDFSLGIFFRQRWVDSRLAFNNMESAVDIPGQLIDSIWKPDLFFPNEKVGILHDITVKNRILKVYPNGTVWYSCRYSVKLACNMYLRHFPMDYQNCSFRISSYSYVTDDVILNWYTDNPLEFDPAKFKLKQFEVKKAEAGHCAAVYKTGDFSCLQAFFVLKRRLGYFLMQAYIPSTLIIVVSWISFWISKEAVPARISLGVTTVLTMTTQLSSAKSTTIQVSYPKALDLWYTVCMCFVFLAQIEYAFVNVWMRSEKRRFKSEDKKRATMRALKERARVSILSDTPEREDNDNEDPGLKVAMAAIEDTDGDLRSAGWTDKLKSFHDYYFATSKGLDNISRFLFPGTFIVFNFVYWPYYMQPVIMGDDENID